MKYLSAKTFVLVSMLFINIKVCTCQEVKIDSIFYQNRLYKTETKKNNLKHGISKRYMPQNSPNKEEQFCFYINENLYGLEIFYDWNGKLVLIRNYRNNVLLYQKAYLINGTSWERYDSKLKILIRYDEKMNIESILYPELNEEIYFHPNKYLKSIIISDTTKKQSN